MTHCYTIQLLEVPETYITTRIPDTEQLAVVHNPVALAVSPQAWPPGTSQVRSEGVFTSTYSLTYLINLPDFEKCTYV